METDLMWEVVSSVQLLQHGEGGAHFDWWRRHVRDLVARDRKVGAAVRALTAVAPFATYFPDFLTPDVDVPDLDTGVDVVLSTAPARLLDEIDRLRATTGTTAWLDDLARGDLRALGWLRTALRTYVKEVIQPYRQTVEQALGDERADRLHTYLRHGPDGLLAGFEPLMRWRPPVLTIDYAVDRELHLDGRGLLLVPCYFGLHRPVALADPEMRPVLVFPVRPEFRFTAHHTAGSDLGALLGPTRAAILRSTLAACTTAGLAKLNDISPATVSHHTGVLRNAGLITTHRRANAANHLITPLGMQLLDKCRTVPPRPVGNRS
ncbi:ArsR/SmtB family transcription factor [Saccharothrix sp. HUAS TT1]|uniref:ArsR/SmtB family transcription factor n=1 Tax=unclassified Saccharothrix TaxID=2593673 RepID=UPI00345C2F66